MKVYDYDMKTQKVKESRQFDFVEILQTVTINDEDKAIKATSGMLATDLAQNDVQDVPLQEGEYINKLWYTSEETSYFVPSQHFKSLPWATALFMARASTIITDDEVSMEELSTHLLESIKNDPNDALRLSRGERNFNTSFYHHP